jgi:hypothetical protein
MLYREIIAVCSQIHTKHMNTHCGEKVELLNVKMAYVQWPLGFEGLIYITRKFSPYRSVHTLYLCYKNQPVNDV